MLELYSRGLSKRGDTVKTDSIISMLDSLYNKTEGFSQEELDGIKSVNIFRMSYTGSLLSVDFSDLDKFNNLKKIAIDGCTVDKRAMESVCKHEALDSFTLSDCDVIEDAYPYFEKIQVDKLYFINTNIDLNRVPGYYNLVYLENMEIEDIDTIGDTLDVSRSIIKNIDFIVTSSFNEVIVSKNQYLEFQYIIDNCGKNVVVREENGQFISKDVTK